MCEKLLKKHDELDDSESEFSDGYEHFEEWEENVEKCALFLNSIYAVDPRWPRDEHLCIIRLHELKTLRYL